MGDLDKAVDTLHTPEELAAALKMHPETIRRMLREGRIPGRKFSRSWRITSTTMNDVLQGKIDIGMPVDD